MQVSQVDERTSSWEDWHPVFRVYFHQTFDEDGLASSTDTYDVTDADVLQVLDWAQHQAAGRMLYAVALVGQREPDGPEVTGQGLTWLVGMDGTSTPLDRAAQDVKARMIDRLRHPVTVPEADRTPPGVPQPYAPED